MRVVRGVCFCTRKFMRVVQGVCLRVRSATQRMFKRQKLDSKDTKMPENEVSKSPNLRKKIAVGEKKKTAEGKSHAEHAKLKFKLSDFETLPTPIKAESDKKEYQVIKLSNGLMVTLVSDTPNLIDLGASDGECSESAHSDSENSGVSESDEDMTDSDVEGEGGPARESKEKLAACALTVEVGSFSDPDDVQGLSHFLEHMVFMGSEKYPKENEFDSFIRRHGGSDNAFTECHYTTYHFECPEKQLFRAMDIFSQFFIKPLLKWDAIDREREAIESEFQEAFPHDSYRRDQLLCSFATKENPARKFTWGNQYTLRDNVEDKHLYDTVNEYRKTHYSSDRMKLAIQARLPIDLLRQWVLECFSQVPKFPNNAHVFNSTGQLFDMDKFCRFYYVKSMKDGLEVEMRWVLPPVLRRYRTKPLKYLSFIIGHEGKGSLLSYLKSKLWALGLRAGYEDDGLNSNELYTIFAIGVTLTDEGRAAMEDVLKATFSYIKMLQETGPDKRLFDEIQSLAETGFRFQEEPSAEGNVENISQAMLLYPPEDYLRGDELMFDYNPEEISDFLSKMIPSTANVMFFAKNHQLKLDKEEFWFKTKYRSEPIPEKWMKSWNEAEANQVFQLPEKNEFITTDFSMVPHEKVPKYPQKIQDSDLMEIWYKGDDKFMLPIASVDILIVTPKIILSAEHRVLIDMYIKLLHHQVVEELYHANAADLQYVIAAKEVGLHIGVYGYNQHLDLLVEKLALGFKDFAQKAEKNILEAFKKLFARSYYNETLKTGNLAKDIRVGAYSAPYFSSAEKYAEVKNISLSKIVDFSNSFFDEVHFQALVQGNLTQEKGISIVSKFITTVEPKGFLGKENFPLRRVKILPKGEKCFRVEAFNLEDKNCVTTVYYQLGPGTINQYVALELFVMIMEEPLFDKLRTQQQLGYDVSAAVRETHGILGMSVTVHSQISKFTVEHVKEKIDEFVYGFVKSFPEMEKGDFQDTQLSLIKLKSNVDTYLKEETKRNLEEISTQEFIFDRLEKEIELISKLDQQAVSSLVSTLITPETAEHKKLVIQVVGHDMAAKENANEVGSSADYQNDVKGVPNSEEITEHVLPENIVYNFLTSKDFPEDYFVTNFEEWKQAIPEYPPHKMVK